MEKIARQISLIETPKRIMEEILVYYSVIYLKIWQKDKKSFKLINQRRSKLIWNVDYNRIQNSIPINHLKTITG